MASVRDIIRPLSRHWLLRRLDETCDWDMAVKQIQSALHMAHNKSINTTPMEALIGCETKSAAEAPLLSQIRDAVHRLNLNELRTDIKAHINQAQRAQKERYDKARRDEV